MVDSTAATSASTTATQAATSAQTSATSQSSSTSLTSTAQTNMKKEDFLKLLVTQLRYQDPLSPEDPKDFVAQLAQFSSLEQQINANQNLQDLGKLFQNLKDAQSMTQGISLLGKTVKGSGNQLTFTGGKALEASFQLPQEAKEVVVNILNSSGAQVRTLNLGSRAAGVIPIAWDGKDSQGKQVSDGIFSYQVSAANKAGAAIQVDNYFTGTVQEVYQDARGVWVKVNGKQVLLNNIVSVVQEAKAN